MANWHEPHVSSTPPAEGDFDFVFDNVTGQIRVVKLVGGAWVDAKVYTPAPGGAPVLVWKYGDSLVGAGSNVNLGTVQHDSMVTFTLNVNNIGDAQCAFSGSPSKVSVSSESGRFVLVKDLPATLSVSASDTFRISVDTSGASPGTIGATIQIPNTVGTFSFSVSVTVS